MANVVSFHRFKENKSDKVIVEDLTKILKLLNITISGLSFYKMYLPVNRLLIDLKNEKVTLESYLSKYEKRIKDHD